MTSCFVYKVRGLAFHDRINTQLIYRFELAQVESRRITKPQRLFLGSNLTDCKAYRAYAKKRVIPLTLVYFYCEFEFRAHFQCVVCTYYLNCAENANQFASSQGKIHEYSYEVGSVSAFTNRYLNVLTQCVLIHI